MLFQERLYQTKAKEACRAHYAAGKRGIVLVAPTGAGKTYMASIMIAMAIERARRCLFIAPREELVLQCYRTLREMGLNPSVIQAGRDHMTDYSNPLQVASKDTYAARLEKHRLCELKFDLIIPDECHHLLGAGWRKIMDAYPDARRLGLTATPYRLDGQGLGTDGLFDSFVIAAQVRELIAQGYLVAPRYIMGKRPDLGQMDHRGGDYATSDISRVMNKARINGDAVKKWLEHTPGERTITFCADRKHAMAVMAEFLAAGVPSEYLDGDTEKKKLRPAVLDRLRSGDTLNVVNVGVLTEGFDEPLVTCEVDLRPTESFGLYVQMGGRILRIAPGKTRATRIDLSGNGWQHGPLEQEIEVDLNASKRTKTTRPAKESLVICPNEECGWAHPAVEIEWPASNVIRCPQCGAYIRRRVRSEVTVNRNGQVREVPAEELLDAAKNRTPPPFGSIMGSCFAKGMSPYAALHTFERRAGRKATKEEMESDCDIRVRWRRDKETKKNALVWETREEREARKAEKAALLLPGGTTK